MTTAQATTFEQHPFLREIPLALLSRMGDCVRSVQFAPGETLTRAGRPAEHFYLLSSGRVVVTAPCATEPLVVHTALPGELVGWSFIVAPYRYRFDSTAVEPVTAFEVDGPCLREKFEEYPALGYQLLSRVTAALGGRVDDLQLRLLDVYRCPGGG